MWSILHARFCFGSEFLVHGLHESLFVNHFTNNEKSR
jgi:hypothetical protein